MVAIPGKINKLGYPTKPFKEIDEKKLRKYALNLCTYAEMAALCGCSEDTLQRRFTPLIESARSERKHELREAQIKLALSGNATMQIWLGKNELGQKEPQNSDIHKAISDIAITVHPSQIIDEDKR